MIRIAKLTDYGIVLLTHVAQGPLGAVHNARDLAEHTRLPLPTVSKLLKSLLRAGLLASQRGSHGGYTLAHPPREISVAEIIRALEGPIAMTECSHDLPGFCDLEASCPTMSNWRKINRAVHSALEGLSLADMSQPLPRYRPAPLETV